MLTDSSGSRPPAASLCFGALLILAVGLCIVGIGCRKAHTSLSGVTLEESITPQPVHTGTETVSFRLIDAARQPISGAHVQVEGDMNHPGMAPVFSDAVETSPGNYRAALDLTMGGDWVLLFHITLGDGRKIERQLDVKGVASN